MFSEPTALGQELNWSLCFDKNMHQQLWWLDHKEREPPFLTVHWNWTLCAHSPKTNMEPINRWHRFPSSAVKSAHGQSKTACYLRNMWNTKLFDRMIYSTFHSSSPISRLCEERLPSEATLQEVQSVVFPVWVACFCWFWQKEIKPGGLWPWV